MYQLKIGNVVIEAVCGFINIAAIDEFGYTKFDTLKHLGEIADGDDGKHTIEVLSGYYDHVAPIDGWEAAFQDVIVMARLFCIPDEVLAQVA